MPTKDRTGAPKIKVEEIEDLPKEKASEKETTESILVPPKVTSFSQLDSVKEKPKRDYSGESEPPEEQKTKTEEEKSETPEEKPETEQEEKPEISGGESLNKSQVSSEEVKEWLKEVRPDTSKEVEKSGGINAKAIIVLIIVFMIIGAIVGGALYYKKGVANKEETMSQEQKEEATTSPTPTGVLNEEEVDVKTLSVSVLNGSGKAGEAGKVKDLLTEAGFAEDKLKTGNADSYEYKSTAVSLKKTVPDSVFENIKKALETDYEVTKSDQILNDDSTFDIIIIVGSKKS